MQAPHAGHWEAFQDTDSSKHFAHFNFIFSLKSVLRMAGEP